MNHLTPETPVIDEKSGQKTETIADATAEFTGQINPENPPARPTDAYGRTFDPAIHVVNPDGVPKLTKNGKLRCKMRTSPKAQADDDGSDPSTETAAEATAAAIPSASSAATQIATLIFSMMDIYGCKYFGDRWKATPEESQALTQAWAAYITYKGWDKPLSPEFAVLAASAMYLAPRIDIIAEKFARPRKYVTNTADKTTGG